jgi:hypothetical protein
MDAENIVYDLAENTAACLPEMIEAFRTETTSAVPSYTMMALDIARIPESVPFLAEFLAEGDPQFLSFAKNALKGIDTRESRTALWQAEQSRRHAREG